jgi:hypothetical protein
MPLTLTLSPLRGARGFEEFYISFIKKFELKFIINKWKRHYSILKNHHRYPLSPRVGRVALFPLSPLRRESSIISPLPTSGESSIISTLSTSSGE